MIFKTNLKCSGCVAAIKPALDEHVGQGKWKVDLTAPERTLTVETDVPEEKIKELLAKAGYRAERLN
ncbi:MAG: heavy-metal-associated domain-containing protein [Cyclobacteriaceae bacterium]|nr:heavy-metal-associated domain-containing protein [Cyclobacteriaceae bacterium]MCX7636958.1 heavy-metal-associated domain-containing protein [Cyclobacteriaceae bacterium]MDW8330473.1 heavy-metal-associated domain-containing protein [Cyclobacteriaceae bacterium]